MISLNSTLPFCKFTGCGNDFILIDHRKKKLDIPVPQLCDRRRGIGADGVILLENSREGDYAMRIFNADGSEAEMCGNGIRCLGNFLREIGETRHTISIETMNHVHRLDLLDNGLVGLEMGSPAEVKWNIALDNGIVLDYLDTGVPHAVIFVEDLESADMITLAPSIRYHQIFEQRGTNVDFVEVRGEEVWLRTYERGVEGETLACGTGAAAAGIAAAKRFDLKSPIKIIPRSRIPIQLDIKWEGDTITDLRQIGPAECVYRGFI